jgi:hypothetical protein
MSEKITGAGVFVGCLLGAATMGAGYGISLNRDLWLGQTGLLTYVIAGAATLALSLLALVLWSPRHPVVVGGLSVPGKTRLEWIVLWVELFALPLSAIALVTTMIQLTDARTVAREEREERYRDILYETQRGVSERWRALTTLLDMGVSSSGLTDNLTCDPAPRRCVVESFVLEAEEEKVIRFFSAPNWDFTSTNLKNITFSESDFEGARLDGTLDQVEFWDTNFDGAEVDAGPRFATALFSRGSFSAADFSETHDLSGIVFDYTNLSGAILCQRPLEDSNLGRTEPADACPNFAESTFANAYYTHYPPIGLEWFTAPPQIWHCPKVDIEFRPHRPEDFKRAGCVHTPVVEQLWSHWELLPASREPAE